MEKPMPNLGSVQTKQIRALLLSISLVGVVWLLPAGNDAFIEHTLAQVSENPPVFVTPPVSCECSIMKGLETCQVPSCPYMETYVTATKCLKGAITKKGGTYKICEAIETASVSVSCKSTIKQGVVVSCTAAEPITVKKCEMVGEKCTQVEMLVLGACKKNPGRDGWVESNGCTSETFPPHRAPPVGSECGAGCLAEKVSAASGCLTPLSGIPEKRGVCRWFQNSIPVPVPGGQPGVGPAA